MKQLIVRVAQFVVFLALLGIYLAKDYLVYSQREKDSIPVEFNGTVIDLTYYLEGREKEFQERFSRPLFFTETSGRGALDPRQMCTVESFAHFNPEIQVIIHHPP